MKTVEVGYQDSVAILKLNRGITNALNLRLAGDLVGALKGMKEDPKVRALVLCSNNDKFFSIGFDIPELFDLSKEDFRPFYQTFNRACMDLYAFPKPTVAAITGHAIGGGCSLSICCDYRFIAEGWKLMGFNDVKLGFPITYPADRILRQLVGERFARDIVYGGEFYRPEDLLQMGMVDLVLSLDQVLPKSVEKAGSLGEMPQDAFAMIKQSRVDPVEAEVLNHEEEKERLFMERWHSHDTRERLERAMEKF